MFRCRFDRVDRVRPSLVAGNGQQSQAPPPYYAENKALEHSLDHALAMEDSKTPAYSQPGYGYHQPNHNINGKCFWIIFRIREKKLPPHPSKVYSRLEFLLLLFLDHECEEYMVWFRQG